MGTIKKRMWLFIHSGANGFMSVLNLYVRPVSLFTPKRIVLQHLGKCRFLARNPMKRLIPVSYLFGKYDAEGTAVVELSLA